MTDRARATGPVTRVIGRFLPDPSLASISISTSVSVPAWTPWPAPGRAALAKCVFVRVRHWSMQSNGSPTEDRPRPPMPRWCQRQCQAECLAYQKWKLSTYNFAHGFSLWRHKRWQCCLWVVLPPLGLFTQRQKVTLLAFQMKRDSDTHTLVHSHITPAHIILHGWENPSRHGTIMLATGEIKVIVIHLYSFDSCID